MLLFALPPHERLGRTIARGLRARLGRIEHRVFSDGERYVRPVTPVRPPSPKASEGQGRQDVIILANTGPDAGALLDLLILLHALHTSGARHITLVIPYLAYARQDRPDKPQAPVTIALLARLLETAGATSVILVDPHSPVAAHSFRIPVRIVQTPILNEKNRGLDNSRKHRVSDNDSDNAPVFVAPDAGARHRAQRLARLLNTRDVIVLRKGRPRPNIARVAALTPQDHRRVTGRPAILVDDIIDTAGTITAAARRLRAAGASRITILATHAVLSGPAISRLHRARINQIIVSDSLALPSAAHSLPLRVVSLAPALTSALRATYRKKRHAGIA